MGHPFTQGTADSNEVWLDVTVTSGDKVIGRSGGIDGDSSVDPWSHFINVFMLDKDGNRIDRRNPQDIFVALYNNQIPPGAAGTVHYSLPIPADVTEPVTVEVKLQYRKFDKIYMDFVTKNAKPGDRPIRGHTPGKPYRNELPITTLASDKVTFPVEGSDAKVENPKVEIPVWQRWNDYGIGLHLKGKAEMKQAEHAFKQLEAMTEAKRYDGPLNLARVYLDEGRLDEATAAIARASEYTDPPAPAWTIAWLSGRINLQQGRLEEAEANFRSVLVDSDKSMQERGFDFSLDYEVVNLLGQTLYERAKQIRDPDLKLVREDLLKQATAQFQKTLRLDSENVTAHYGLSQLYQELGNEQLASFHQKEHAKYKPDDNARDVAHERAKVKYPAAAKASEPLVIYPLARPGAPGLSVAQQPEPTEGTKSGDD